MTDMQQSLLDFGDLPNGPKQRVEWNEVKNVAVTAFDLWNGSGELAWAERAWGHLADAGLASLYSASAWSVSALTSSARISDVLQLRLTTSKIVPAP